MKKQFFNFRNLVRLFSLSLILTSQTCALAAGSFPYQNKEVEKLAGDKYTPAKLKTLRTLLDKKGTFYLRRYSSGGHSAVTISDNASLESSISGLLIMHWDRDNIMQALAERASGDEKWKEGLAASLNHHLRYRQKLVHADPNKRPHIRYNAVSLDELTEPWGHAQNDALSFLEFLLFHDLNQNHSTLNQTTRPLEIKAAVLDINARLTYAVLLPHYFEKIKVWQDIDLGAWEDKRAVHSSSIACALGGLREQYEYVTRHGAIKHKVDGREYVVDEKMLRELIGKCKKAALAILPNEYVTADDADTRSDTSKVRAVDAAIINALYLGAISGRPLFDDKLTVSLIENVENKLMGPLGIARYPGDIWDGRQDRRDLDKGQEAQWCHVSPMISYIYGEMYRRTGKAEYFQKEVEHFNRGLAHINGNFKIPEAYIVDPVYKNNGRYKWIADANEPLAWAQSVTLLSFIGIEESLKFQSKEVAQKGRREK